MVNYQLCNCGICTGKVLPSFLDYRLHRMNLETNAHIANQRLITMGQRLITSAITPYKGSK